MRFFRNYMYKDIILEFNNANVILVQFTTEREKIILSDSKCSGEFLQRICFQKVKKILKAGLD